MPTISIDPELLTVINVFTVEPARQAELVDLLSRATQDSVRRVAGFVSASLHRSLDGAKVAMYAQWRSRDDYEAMRRNPVASPYLDRALTFTRFEPGMYAVVETFEPAAA